MSEEVKERKCLQKFSWRPRCFVQRPAARVSAERDPAGGGNAVGRSAAWSEGGESKNPSLRNWLRDGRGRSSWVLPLDVMHDLLKFQEGERAGFIREAKVGETEEQRCIKLLPTAARAVVSYRISHFYVNFIFVLLEYGKICILYMAIKPKWQMNSFH